MAAIREGMLAVTQTGSLAAAFQDLPFQAGAKTGSAQVTGEENANAVLVCFAPYDDPQIALAVVVEQGGSGAAWGRWRPRCSSPMCHEDRRRPRGGTPCARQGVPFLDGPPCPFSFYGEFMGT